MNIANNRKMKQSSQNFGSNSQTFRPGFFSAQLSGVQTPSTLLSAQGLLSTMKNQSNLMFGQTFTKIGVDSDSAQLISRPLPTKVFNYEAPQEKLQGTISGAFDIQPQYSMHSPFRGSESRKEFSNQTALPESSVKGRRLGGREGDVVLSIGSQDPIKSEILSSIGSHGNDFFSTQLTSLRERSENSKDSRKNAFQVRKSSSESQGRQGRFQARGKSEQKRGKTNSNSQSRQKKENDPRANQAYNQIRASHAQQAALRRPNSAKNLKQVPSMANMHNMQRTLVTSPTQQILQRENSQNILPPKPKSKPLRNQAMAKLPQALYQSVSSLHSAFSQQPIQPSSQATKRAPSASSERHSKELQQNVQNYQTLSQDHQEALSPIRKNHHMTQPTSNTKTHYSNQKGLSRARKDKTKSSQKKLKSPNQQHIMQHDLQNLQNLSPNLERVKISNNQSLERKLPSSNLKSFDDSNKPNQSINSSTEIKKLKVTKPSKIINENALSQELFKTIKQQIQHGLQDEEKKKQQKIGLKGKFHDIQPKKFNLDMMKQELAQRMETKVLAKKAKKQDPLNKEQELLKARKQQQKEQWLKEKEERQECLDIVKEALKQPLKQGGSACSQSRKREISQNKQKQVIVAEQVLVKVPPVQEEEVSPQQVYEEILSLKNSNQDSPMRDLRFQQEVRQQENKQITVFMKKQKRERSKRKKIDEKKEIQKELKKELALKVLQDQCMKRFENYKTTFTATHKAKGKKAKKQKQESIPEKPKRNLGRSKSKRRIDDEKENRRQSLSAGKNKEPRSGTKSDKKKKSKDFNQNFSQVQLMALQKNVLDLLKLQTEGEGKHQRKPSLTKKSNTQVNLHSNIRHSTDSIPKNQILISKSQLKALISQQKRPDSQEQNLKAHGNPVQETQQLQELMESNDYRPIFVSEQHLELTPIIQPKNRTTKSRRDHNDQKNAHAIRPIDSLPSMHPGSIISKLSRQSVEDLALFKTKDKIPVKLAVAKSIEFNKLAQPSQSIENPFKSRSSSIQESIKNQTSQKRKSSKSKKQVQEVKSPSKQSQQTKSPDKNENIFAQRKGSAGFKRSMPPQVPLVQQNLDQKQSKNIEKSSSRPRSAATEKVNLLDVLQQQHNFQQQQQIIQQQQLNQIRYFSSILVQKFLRGYLARKEVHALIKQKYEQQFKNQMNYSNKVEILDKELSSDRSRQSSFRNSLSKLSKSEISLKELIQSEVRRNKSSRPSSSSNIKPNQENYKKPASSSNRASVNLEQDKTEKFPNLVQIIEEELKEEVPKDKIQIIQVKDRKKSSDVLNDSRRDSFLKSLMNESFSKSNYKQRKPQHFINNKFRRDEDAKSVRSHLLLSNSQILGTEDRDISWQFDRKSMQDFFDHNSQILKEESKRQSLGALQDSTAKSVFQNKLQQYEVYLSEMERKTQEGRSELQKLNNKKVLSPASQKRKLHLEKWVNIQEQKLQKKKKWVTENMNDFINKMDQDLQLTKKKIGSGPKGSLKFNSSHEWSQHDMSLGHITSSSIHSTPRIINQGSLTGSHISQNIRINNNSAFATNKSDRVLESQVKPKKLFDYKIPIKHQVEDQEELTSIIKTEQIQVSDKQLTVLQGEKDSFKADENSNIFTNNLVEDLKHQKQVNDVEVDENEEGESLSKMEPPNFQAVNSLLDSHNNLQLKDIQTDDEDKIAPLPSPPSTYDFQSSHKESRKPIQKKDEDYAEAFLALKEPEQPISVEKIKQIQIREREVDGLTDFVLALLLDQMTSNMFPRRPLVNGAKLDKEESEVQEEEKVKEESIVLSNNDKQDQNQELLKEPLALIPQSKKKKKRGIKTSMRTVDGYLGSIFKRIKDNEDEFIENLSTPLNKDPLEILLHLQNAFLDNEMENAVAFQQSVLPVDMYLELERNKAQVQVEEDNSDAEMVTDRSMLGEWENIHNKVIFDGINEALDNYRPYGLRGPPMPWSQQTRTLTYKNGQQVDMVMRQVRLKVMEWSRTFAGALPCSELLLEYGIKGPLDEEKLNLLREERLALLLSSEIEENELLWTDYEYEETQTKLDVADMILEFLAEEACSEMTKIQDSRSTNPTANSTQKSSRD